MKILVTGGAGFIGTNLVNHLFHKYQDCEIVVLDALTYAGNLENFSQDIAGSARFTFWRGDVCNTDLVMDLVSSVDAVIHLAAETHVARSIYEDRKFFMTDVMGTQSVANAVLRNRDRIYRFIHVSTSEVYGSALSETIAEDHAINPANPYAAAKAGADRLVYSYRQTYGIPAVILRPFNQYGPYQHLEKVIPRFITSALLDEPLTIHGTGGPVRDWLYVEDTCDRIDKVLHAPKYLVEGEVFNLGSGFALDILNVARMVLGCLDKPRSLVTHIEDRPGQVNSQISCSDKANKVLNFEEGRSFEEGLAQTIHWYSENRRWWERMLPMRRVPIRVKNGKTEYY